MHNAAVDVSISKDFDRVMGWALVALLAAVLFATVTSSSFHFLSLGSLVLGFALVATFLSAWWEKRLEDRFGRLGIALSFGIPLVLYALAGRMVKPPDFLWLLPMPLVSRAVSSLKWSPALLVCALYMLATIWMFNAFRSWNAAMNLVLSIGVAYVFTAVCTVATTRACHARAESQELATQLKEANGQLLASAAQRAELATAQERNRIARDIHDGLGHYLTVITVQLQAAQGLLGKNPERAAEALATAEKLTQKALDEVRGSIGTLRQGKPPAPLAERVDDLIKESGLPSKLRVAGTPRSLSPEIEQVLFRSIQEGLTNARKHARAQQVDVVLAYRADGYVAVEVCDDGLGSAPTTPGGFGLLGLRERAAVLGGSLSAAPRPEGGFRLQVEVPS